jgi:hypothetical protein
MKHQGEEYRLRRLKLKYPEISWETCRVFVMGEKAFLRRPPPLSTAGFWTDI